MLVRYILYTALLYGAVLSQLSAMPAYAAELTRMPALPVPRGGGSLACGEAGRQRAAQTTACTFTVQFRWALDSFRLHLMRQALQRRQTVRYALPREVDLHMAPTRVMLSHWKSGVPVPGELAASFANLSKPLKGT